MPKLTHRQARDYIAEGGFRCPFCKSESIESTGRDHFDGSEIYREIECHNCKARWQDEFMLHDAVDAEDIEDNGVKEKNPPGA